MRASDPMAAPYSEPIELGPLPVGRPMTTVDEALVRSSVQRIFDLARRVEEWPALLPHYRRVKFRERARDGGGLVEMAADRPFGVLRWPTWWLSRMRVREATSDSAPSIRFRHVGGITTGMDVEWSFIAAPQGTHVRIVHVWDGPRWPLFGIHAATVVIGPVFIHGIASRTLSGLARIAEGDSGVPLSSTAP